MIADELRTRILSGAFRDGAMLPSQDRLLEEFRVSKPSLRGALRILEAEKLITVRRGNVGGATVHVPNVDQAGYTLALVLQSQQTTLDDVGHALRQLEPVCAALCALRDDRAVLLTPLLRASIALAKRHLHEEARFIHSMADFHEQIISGCGNNTLTLVVGATKSMWTAHLREWTARVAGTDNFPTPERRMVGIEDHEAIVDLIEAGDAVGVAALMRAHFDPGASYSGTDDGELRITATVLNDAEHNGYEPPR